MNTDNEPISVLFVDDDEAMLTHIRRLIFATQLKWNASFITSGAQALEMLKTENFDVIVTDLEMPYMSGADFLRKLKDQHPETVRIAVAEEVDIGNAVRLAPIAHHLLVKPLEPTKLRSLVERAAAVQKQLSADNLRKKFDQLDVLPSPPQHIIELNQLLNSAEPSVEKISTLVSADAGLSAAVLHLVNSAYFGLVSEIANLHHATAYLGITAIRDLAVAVELTNQFKNASPAILKAVNAINDHSQIVGGLTSELLRSTATKQNGFTAGLLHDVGLMAMASIDSAKFEEINALGCTGHCIGTKDNLSDAEVEILGTSHSSLGGYLLTSWGLSYQIVEAVARHHDVDHIIEVDFEFEDDSDEEDRELGLVQAVHIADALSRQQSHAGASECPLTTPESLESYGVASIVAAWTPQPVD